MVQFHNFNDGGPMVRKRSPSMLALRAFYVASRTGNYTRAAEELLLTQSAVSRHIQNLEADLGFALFQRNGRKMVLTAAGEQLKAIVSDAFDRLSIGMDTLCARENSTSLTMSMLPSVAAQWLAPRIGKFSADNPEVILNIQCTRALVDFERDNVDLSIRYGEGKWPGCRSELLLCEDISVVCSPKWRKRLRDVHSPIDFCNFPLLHGDSPDNWIDYFQACGEEDIKVPPGPVFSDDNALLKAAIEGQGLILGRSVLVDTELQARRLFEPLNFRIPTSYSYWLVAPDNRPLAPTIKALRQFLFDEAESFKQSQCVARKAELL